MQHLDEIDRRIVEATDSGLPIVAEPYREVGRVCGLDADEVMRRLARMQAMGVIRRIGAAPNHYALGYHANGMSVWDVDDAKVDDLGARIGALDFVTHCYRRPRCLPDWPYNLFAMVHGRDRTEVDGKVAKIAALLGDDCRGADVLFSTRILKKTGLRVQRPGQDK